LIAAQPASASAFAAFAGEIPVTITNSDISSLNILTIPPISVAGEIAWDKPPTDSSLKPTIAISHIPVPGGFPRPSAQVTLPGEFSLTMAPTVEYSLVVSAQMQGAPAALTGGTYVKDILYGGASVLHGSIRPGDASARLRIVLASDGGALDIAASRTDGTPAVRTAILILPASTRSEAEFAATMMAALTDDTGAYRVGNVPPGRYYVLATDDPPVSQVSLPTLVLSIVKTPERLGFLQRVRATGQLVEVNPNATVQVRVTPRTLE
jgi:hypothetical protein